jgi:hypothetical protein
MVTMPKNSGSKFAFIVPILFLLNLNQLAHLRSVAEFCPHQIDAL